MTEVLLVRHALPVIDREVAAGCARTARRLAIRPRRDRFRRQRRQGAPDGPRARRRVRWHVVVEPVWRSPPPQAEADVAATAHAPVRAGASDAERRARQHADRPHASTRPSGGARRRPGSPRQHRPSPAGPDAAAAQRRARRRGAAASAGRVCRRQPERRWDLRSGLARACEQSLAARDVDVARAQGAALGGQARAVQAHEGQRDAALALSGRVATPHVGEALEVQRGDEGEAQAPDRLPGLAGDRLLDGDAVVAADRPC